VDKRVLVPRPETEQLVELGRKFLAEIAPGAAARRVLDVGTGSGILAVTLAVKCPSAQIVASDISDGALRVARANAVRHGVEGRVAFVESDLLSAFAPGWCELLVANLPYIPSADLRGLAVFRHEPALALDGGPDGLGPYRRLMAEAPRVMTPGGRMVLEIEHRCGPRAKALAESALPEARVAVHRDLADLDRVVEITL
jgi:release factor glutamine methyltransferase